MVPTPTDKNDKLANLVVILDSELPLNDKLIASLSQHSLRNIAQARPYISMHNAKKLAHAFLLSHIDYFNSLLTALSVIRLQLFQNIAVQVLTGTHK